MGAKSYRYICLVVSVYSTCTDSVDAGRCAVDFAAVVGGSVAGLLILAVAIITVTALVLKRTRQE